MMPSAEDKVAAEGCRLSGDDLASQERYAEAIKLYKRAHKLDPTDALLWADLAICYHSLCKYKDLKIAVEKSLEMNHEFIHGYDLLALAQISQYELKKQEIQYKRV